MLSYRQKMLKTIKGEEIKEIPFVPRLDNWYMANKLKGTLPAKYQKATLMEITRDLNVGFHAVMPDLQGYQDPLDDVDRALGIWRVRDLPYRIILNGVQRNVFYEDDERVVEYLTPYGKVRARTRYSQKAREAGITITDILERLIKDEDDFKAVAYIYENAEVLPQYDLFQERVDQIGERGLAVALVNFAASPMHAIHRYLMKFEDFFIKLMEEPETFESLVAKIQGFYDKLFAVAVNSPADIIFLGANYDRNITPPPFYEKHILPSLQKYSKKIKEQGKYLLSHTDGENDGLLELYNKSGIDIADSVCPAPMTKLPFMEYKKVLNNNITIWGGIPSVAVLDNSMSEYDFDKFIDNFFSEQIGDGKQIILSIADTVPPAANFARVEKIAKICQDYNNKVGSG